VEHLHLVQRQWHGAGICNYGGFVVSVEFPIAMELRRCGARFDNLDSYLKRKPVFGRSSAGMAIALPRANSTWRRHLHSGEKQRPQLAARGIKGFDKVVWQAKRWQAPRAGVGINLRQQGCEEGFPAH